MLISPASAQKHLHGRGEDSPFGESGMARPGNTSTGVEKTQPAAVSFVTVWKHLHGRGEDHQQ